MPVLNHPVINVADDRHLGDNIEAQDRRRGENRLSWVVRPSPLFAPC